MKVGLLAAALLCACSSTAGIEVSVVDRIDGSPIPSSAVKLDVRRSTDEGGVETVACRLTGLEDRVTQVRLEARLPLETGRTMSFDGRQELALTGIRTNALFMGAFPMGAAWAADGRAVALALGAEAGDSYADLVLSPQAMAISVHAALLRKGAVYETVFHRIPFDPKYGVRDAFAGYYPLYPKRFRRNPTVDPGICGVNATYSSWRRADPEPCRFMNATVECCIGASRTWGDVNDREQPVGPRNTAYSWDEEIGYVNRAGKYRRRMNGEITQAEFDAIRDERLGYGFLCGVRNAYYVMALANISNEIAKRHPDSVAVGKSFSDNSYPYSTDVFAFPECSWGQDIRRQLKELSESADISSVYFDVSRPRAVYRGERLKEMANVSWDEYGPGIVRGVASAKLFDYVRTLKAKKSRYNLGVTVNTKYEHIADIFAADMTESESAPWDHEKPFPIERRLAAGEKGFSLWEGFSTDEFDPNFRKWPQADKDRLINALSKFAVHASFRTGAALPVSFMSEYTALLSHAFVRMDAAGWKPVPGARVRGEGWELARYGLGGDSWLSVNNLTNAVRQAAVEVFPSEIATGRAGGTASGSGWLYVPFYGGTAQTRIRGGREGVSLRVGPQLTGILEAVGELKGEGDLTTEWTGDFEALRLKIVSRGFTGAVSLKESFDGYVCDGSTERRVSSGASLDVTYRNAGFAGVLPKIRALGEVKAVRCAADDDSKDLAERIARFFGQASGGPRPTVRTDGGFRPLTVAFGDIILTSDDRWRLSQQVNRVLNVVNRERFPQYRPPTPMADTDRVFYPFLRF